MGSWGLLVDGKRFDIGLPDYYLETLEVVSRCHNKYFFSGFS